jgi:hypothetical protein
MDRLSLVVQMFKVDKPEAHLLPVEVSKAELVNESLPTKWEKLAAKLSWKRDSLSLRVKLRRSKS